MNTNGHNLGLGPGNAIGVHQHHAQGSVPVNLLQSITSTAAGDHAGQLFDLSSFDPLQAHAFQLTASAGLTNMLVPQPSSMSSQPQNMTSNDGSHQQPQHLQTGQAQQLSQGQQGNPQQPYYYMQQQTGQTGLQPIAPAQGLTSQPAPQNYILPAQGAAMGVAQGYQQQILASNLASAPPGTTGLLPNLLMSQHLHTVVTNSGHHPAPLAPAMNLSHKRESDDVNHADRQASKKQREMAPSVVSSSTNSYGGNLFGNLGPDKPPQEASQADLDKMTPAERRRYERNLREQQRSYKISQQIKELRDVLSESNVPFKPNKYSILLSVVDYIKQLQARAIMLDAEHQKLITTIRQTNEMVHSGAAPSSASEMESTTCASDSGSDNELLFVQGLDYRSVFDQCPAALGVAALDGRIMECNPEFQILLGFPRDDLLKQSLFNLVRNHQDIFRAMAEMLKGAERPNTGQETVQDWKNRFWSGDVISKRDIKVSS
jgi:PAS domain-containing protein